MEFEEADKEDEDEEGEDDDNEPDKERSPTSSDSLLNTRMCERSANRCSLIFLVAKVAGRQRLELKVAGRKPMAWYAAAMSSEQKKLSAALSLGVEAPAAPKSTPLTSSRRLSS